MTNHPAIRIIKVGGSLFDLPDLPQRLEQWLADQTEAHNVFVVGGGPLVEQMRRWHQAQRAAGKVGFEEVHAHWICIDLMSITARVLQAWIPAWKYTTEIRLLQRRVAEKGVTLFDVAKWMRSEEPALPGTQLPCQWEVSSDSIAGRLAIALEANELVLLKSTWPESSSQNLIALAEEAYIDRMLPLLSAELPPLRLVNLRS